MDDLHVVHRYAEFVRDDLRERRLVALPLRLDGDAQHGLACGMDAEFGAVRHAEPRMSMCLRGPAPTASVKKLIPMPISGPPLARRSACSARSLSYPAMSMALRSVRG